MKQQFLQAVGEILAFLGFFFMEISVGLYAIGFLIIADTFTGIWAARKRKEHVTSRRLGGIVPKIILYPLAIIVAKVAQDYLVPDIPWIPVTTGILAVIEIKSFFENTSDILGYNLWKRIKKAVWKDKIEDELGRKDSEDV